MDRVRQVEWVAHGSVSEHPKNPRQHGERDLSVIKASVAEHGLYAPLVVQRSTGYVLVGNGRLAALRDLGWETVPVVYVDVTEEEAVRLLLRDNRSAELSAWDFEDLAELFRTLGETDEQVLAALEPLGWDESEAGPLLAADFVPSVISDDSIDGVVKLHHVAFTTDQWAVVTRACGKLRGDEDHADLSDARCVELICAEYLS